MFLNVVSLVQPDIPPGDFILDISQIVIELLVVEVDLVVDSLDFACNLLQLQSERVNLGCGAADFAQPDVNLVSEVCNSILAQFKFAQLLVVSLVEI